MDNYDSRYPLEYYETGTKYIFFKSSNHSFWREATDAELQKYYMLFNANDKIEEGKVSTLEFNRKVGIVVDKITEYDVNRIDVLFNDKIVWQYVTNSPTAKLGNKNQFSNGAFFDNNPNKSFSQPLLDFGDLPTSSRNATKGKSTARGGLVPDELGTRTGLVPDDSKKTKSHLVPDEQDKKQTKKVVKAVIDVNTGEIETRLVPDEVDKNNLSKVSTGLIPDED